MNEFTIWDKDNHKFLDTKNNVEIVFCESIPCGYSVLKKHPYENELLNAEIFPYTGKKDINNKKIYAESSVVEFDFHTNRDGWTIDTDYESIKGYFSWDDKWLKYVLNVINSDRVIKYRPSNFKDLKIIDTIQENKLGLIK